MCLLLLAWKTHPRYRLILAGNRDEFHERPTAPLNWWQDDPRILGGRDLKASGTLTQEELARASDLHRKKINELEKSLKSTKVPLSEMVLLGVLAMRTGKRIEWDGQAGRVTNDPKLNDLVRVSARDGWKV